MFVGLGDYGAHIVIFPGRLDKFGLFPLVQHGILHAHQIGLGLLLLKRRQETAHGAADIAEEGAGFA
ncbi:hypothetical protein D3C75_1329950 [compost metagenome]